MKLEQRTEAIEHEVLTSLYTNCPAATKKVLGFRLVNIDDALLLTAKADPNIMLNRVHGLCGNKEIKPSTIQKIAATYTALGQKLLSSSLHRRPAAGKQTAAYQCRVD